MSHHLLAYTVLDCRARSVPRLDLDLGLSFAHYKEYGINPIVGVTRVLSDYADQFNTWTAVGYGPTRNLPADFGWSYQIDPFALIQTVSNVQSNLYLYGVYSDDADFLVVTTIHNLPNLLGTRYFFHRLDVSSCKLNNARICSRWYRWKRDLKLSSAQRFCILEKNLSKP